MGDLQDGQDKKSNVIRMLLHLWENKSRTHWAWKMWPHPSITVGSEPSSLVKHILQSSSLLVNVCCWHSGSRQGTQLVSKATPAQACPHLLWTFLQGVILVGILFFEVIGLLKVEASDYVLIRRLELGLRWLADMPLCICSGSRSSSTTTYSAVIN